MGRHCNLGTVMFSILKSRYLLTQFLHPIQFIKWRIGVKALAKNSTKITQCAHQQPIMSHKKTITVNMKMLESCTKHEGKSVFLKFNFVIIYISEYIRHKFYDYSINYKCKVSLTSKTRHSKSTCSRQIKENSSKFYWLSVSFYSIGALWSRRCTSQSPAMPKIVQYLQH